MLNLKRYHKIYKYLEMSMHPNITMAYKSALSDLWGNVWHKIGIEWPKNQVPGEKFIKRIYHAHSSSLETICKIAKECGIKLINRIDENEVELIAPGAEDYSIVISQDYYDDSLYCDYSDLEGLSIKEAIDILQAKLTNKKIYFDYIYLRFRIPSEFTGLRTKILTCSPQSVTFREFLIAAKSKLESKAGILQTAIDFVQEPVRLKAQEEKESIARSFQEQCTMMRKRHAFLTAMVSPFSGFDEFMRDNGEWCAILGINLVKCSDYLEITIHLDDENYETYFAVPSMAGPLTISEIVRWQDDYSANTLLNITTQKVADEDEIVTFKN